MMAEGSLVPEWRIVRIERDVDKLEEVGRVNERNIAVTQRDVEEIKEILVSMRRAAYGAMFATVSAAVVFAVTIFSVLK